MTSTVQPNPKAEVAPADRTWDSPDAARMWLKRHPQPGMKVAFDQKRAVFCLIPDGPPVMGDIHVRTNRGIGYYDQGRIVPPVTDEAIDTSDIPEATEADFATARLVMPSVTDEPVADQAGQPDLTDPEPEFAQEPPVMSKKQKAAAAKNAKAATKTAAVKPPKAMKAAPVPKPAKVQAERPAMPADPTGGALCKDAYLVIDGLPDASTAYTWAKEFCKKLGNPIRIVSTSGEFTIDATHLAAVKAASKPAGKPRDPNAEPRAAKTAPEGKRLIVVNLAMRPEGVSTKELVAATGWNGCPWAWSFQNPQGTGLADRYGYGFSKAKVEGEVRYFLVPAPAVTEAQAA
jgi:hypothetical protein